MSLYLRIIKNMSTYKQFCPMAMATELLCQRWNLIILRELHLGSCNFNTIRKGAPRIPPALLSQRLKQLESHKIIFKEKPSFYSEARGVNNNFNYYVFNLFIKLDENNYIHSKIEIYGDALKEERICKGINLLEKTIF